MFIIILVLITLKVFKRGAERTFCKKFSPHLLCYKIKAFRIYYVTNLKYPNETKFINKKPPKY